jgi:hypothetical protein
MFRITRQANTKWWYRYIDGLNPDDPPRKELSKFFRSENINPYSMSREIFDDWRKKYLQEFNWYVKTGSTRDEKYVEATRLIKEKKQKELEKLKKSYSL